jgi:hypothetical protein
MESPLEDLETPSAAASTALESTEEDTVLA